MIKVTLNFGSDYVKKDGTSQFSRNFEKFKKEHPNARYDDFDLRNHENRRKNVAVFDIYYYEYNQRMISKYVKKYGRFVEEIKE